MGVCCGIKLMALLIFLLDWWLIRTRQNAEKKEAALTVGEVVNSIISLDKREFELFFVRFCNVECFAMFTSPAYLHNKVRKAFSNGFEMGEEEKGLFLGSRHFDVI